MRVVEDVREAQPCSDYLAMTVGSFDGVHLGHQEILSKVVASAQSNAGTAGVLTMQPHPREFFSPERAPNLLTPLQKKADLLEGQGVDVLFILTFNADTAAITAEAFVREILTGKCGVRELIVGHDCRFGEGAGGDIHLLEELAPELGFNVEEVPPLVIDGERVSSTLIRERVLQGDLVAVERLLGRPYSLTGQVVRGRGIGVQMGFPTANILPYHSAVPAQGVYIAQAMFNSQTRPAAVNIGIAPTIRHGDVTVEAHVLDFDGDLAGAEIEIQFHQRLRSEKKFPDREALMKQIQDDVRLTREYFGG